MGSDISIQTARNAEEPIASQPDCQYFFRKHFQPAPNGLHQSFIDNALEFIFCTTANDTLLFANDPFIRHFGMPSCQQAIDGSAEVLFETPEDYRRLRDRVLEEQRVTTQTVHFKTANGGRMTGLVNCQCHKHENGMLILNWMVLDISHHVELKTRLRSKNEELKEVNSKMEKFLYSTSHDLRSPLSSILGLINLMRLETKDPEILDYIGKIEGSAVKLDRIVQDLRGFSNTSYKSKKIQRIVLEDLTQKVIASYHGTEYFRQIHFEITAHEREPFFSDAESIEIILDNIIRNAIHFYDANKVRPFVRIAIGTDAKELQLEVMDNGIGISKMHQSLIFDMFYKASHQSRGAGLGLYIVKESIQQLKGSVTVESEIGFGSIFRFRIPNNPGETKEEDQFDS
jgi:signal transduction histidine kinase